MRRPLTLLALALALLLLHAGAHAQTIHGRLITNDSMPVAPGALVLLVDANGRTVASAVSPASGRFSLSAASGGSYTLRISRIGYAPAESGITLAAGVETESTFVLGSARIELPEVRVQGQPMCGQRTEGDSLASVLWGQVSTALALANESVRSKELRFKTIVEQWRVSGLMTDSLLVPQVNSSVYNTAWPVSSPPVDSLVKYGFILHRDDVSPPPVWFGPDAEFLLSELFFATHCFAVIPPTPEVPDAWVGLSFQPATRGGRSDVVGTIWVDRASAELRRIDYGYTRVPVWSRNRFAGGALTFAILASGDWITQRWFMMVPAMRIHPKTHLPYFENYLKSTGFVWQVHDAKGREIARYTP